MTKLLMEKSKKIYSETELRTFYDLYKRASKTHPELESFIKRRGDGKIEG